MPSFKATVLSEINLDGNKYLTLYRIKDRDPIGLIVTAATLEGTNDVEAPQGIFAVPAVVASFPYDTVAAFPVRSKVQISWVDDNAGELVGLALAAI
jgi:hypothetical protein